jgi:endonuclease YncB( thermonuclease family)
VYTDLGVAALHRPAAVFMFAVLTLVALPHPASAAPVAHAAATCSDYSNQAEAQRNADTRDPDGDGVYCEALPCPCARPGSGGGGGGDTPARPRKKKPRKRTQTIRARITKVTDGDTIRVRPLERTKRRSYTVRLIGIDTPEKFGGLECGALQASDSMVRMSFPRGEDMSGDGLLDRGVGRGRRVLLTTDTTQDTFDRYGRLLAYARIRGGPQLNLAQVSRGWAKTYVFAGKPFKLTSRFRSVQRGARAARRGVFGLCGGDFHAAI